MPRRLLSSRWALVSAGLLLAAAFGAFGAWLILQEAAQLLVEDGRGLMSADDRNRIAEHHRYLLADHDIDYRVVAPAQVDDVASYANRRFAELTATALSRTGRGLLLVIDRASEQVRLEVSRSLEGAFPDAFVAYVENRQMVPFFRCGRVADGILATTELIVTRAQKAQANAGFDDEPWSVTSGGGATAEIGSEACGGATPAAVQSNSNEAADTPEDTLRVYFQAMSARDARRDLDIYTPATRAMLERWVMTPAQMDNVVKLYGACRSEPPRTRGRHAVIRYPVAQRNCAPWFLEQSGGKWRLDLTMMQSAIRFGRSNAWHFRKGVSHPYAFAFEDWTFDANGFPTQ